MKPLALALCLLATPALAAECPVERATYGQPGTDWQLRFQPIERDAAANKTASFTIPVPGTDKMFNGGVYQPNGFSSSWGSLTLTCEANYSDPDCTFWEGLVYANGPDGIVTFPIEREAQAPDQVLLPGLASNIWYSMLRNETFLASDKDPIDVFTFAHCAE